MSYNEYVIYFFFEDETLSSLQELSSTSDKSQDIVPSSEEEVLPTTSESLCITPPPRKDKIHVSSESLCVNPQLEIVLFYYYIYFYQSIILALVFNSNYYCRSFLCDVDQHLNYIF